MVGEHCSTKLIFIQVKFCGTSNKISIINT